MSIKFILDTFRRHFCPLAGAILFFAAAGNPGWASNPRPQKPCSDQSKYKMIGPVEKNAAPEPDNATGVVGIAREGSATKSGATGLCLAGSPRLADFPQNLFSDQKQIWSSPFRLYRQDKDKSKNKDRNWLVPFGIGTLALVASDQDIMRHFGNTPLAHSNSFSNYGVAALVSGAAGLYLRGTITNEDHSRETGVLAGEAAVNSVIVAEAMKVVFQRARPNEANAGSFGAGGASFPSEHALAAWSIATVIAHEYPGPLTKLLAYGGATGISMARVAARQHFPSDVVVGSVLGYAIGQYVYRTHHNPKLPGASVDDFEKVIAEKAPPRRRRPSELASPYVPLDSWVYAAFDRLAALGYAPSAYANLRPWTRMECARILEAAGTDLRIDDLKIDNLTGDGRLRVDDAVISSALNPAFVNAPQKRRHAAAAGSEPNVEAYKIYAALKIEFAHELGQMDGSEGSEIRAESIYSRYTGIAGIPLDDSYHFGQTLMNDYGRPYGPGSNTVDGASASGSAGPVAFYVRGEYQHAAALPAYSLQVQQMLGDIDVTPPQLPIHTTVLDQFRLLDAYAAWNFKTVQISAGRQSLWWGPGHGGPPNFSDNATPMDMLRITNPSPWRLPSFFHWLGPMRFDFFFGLMAGHHYPAEPGIDGQKLSFKPTPNLEFGFSRTIVFRPVTPHMFWRGFSSFGDNSTTIPGSAADVGDRRGGFDFSYRVPGLRNWLVVYNDGMTDDDTSPLGAPQRALMNPGVYLPQIPRVSKLDFRAEAVWSDPPSLSNRAGKYVYYNGAYHDSYTNGGQIIGSWVGREGHGLQLWSTYWLSPRNSLQVGYRKAHVDRDFIPSGGNIQDFYARAIFQPRPEIEITAFLQYERWNSPVLSPLAGPDTVASIEFTYHPKWRKALRFQ